MTGRRSIAGFWHGDEWRELVEPDGRPTGRQLLWLNARGLLVLLPRAAAPPITKGECAYAIDRHREADEGAA